MSITLNWKDGVLPWLMLTGMLSVRRCFKASKEKNGKKCMTPQEAQQAKASWAMKAAKDRREEFYDPARKDNILGRKKTRLELWEEHLKDPIAALDKALKCVEHPREVRAVR